MGECAVGVTVLIADRNKKNNQTVEFEFQSCLLHSLPHKFTCENNPFPPPAMA